MRHRRTFACLGDLTARICGGSSRQQGEPINLLDSTAKDTDGQKVLLPVDASTPSASTFRGQPLPYPSMTTLSPADLEVIERRHLYRKLPSIGEEDQGLSRQVVGAGGRCKHGWPQAIVYDPLYRESAKKSYRLGDTTRLTCPLLVSAIDKLEKGGAIERYTERLMPGGDWEGELAHINEAHRLLRLGLVGDRSEELAEVKKLLGPDAFAIAMRGGLASLRPEARPDVKCLHAQVADELVRGGNNPIAQQALRDIEDQGIIVKGSDECCDNCNVGIPLEMARWKMDKCKNNVGKRLSRGRKQSASRAASEASSLAGDIEEDLMADVAVSYAGS